MNSITSPEEMEKLRKTIQDIKSQEKLVITVCGGTGCKAARSQDIINTLKEEIVKQNIQHEVSVRSTGCHGFCEQGPIVVLYPSKICYPIVRTGDVPRIISETVIKNKVIEGNRRLCAYRRLHKK